MNAGGLRNVMLDVAEEIEIAARRHLCGEGRQRAADIARRLRRAADEQSTIRLDPSTASTASLRYLESTWEVRA